MGLRPWRTRSVRARTAFAAALVVGLALAAASVALVVLLGRSLTSDVRDTAAARVDGIAAAIERGDAPNLEVGEFDDEFVQVLGTDGQVVTSSANVEGEPALALIDDDGESHLDRVPFEDGAFLAVGRGASSAGGTSTVIVGRSLDDVQEATRAATGLLLLGVPVLVLVVGLVTWWITARALWPVESIRAEVERITAGGLGRRVPEPATGDEVARLATTMNRMLAGLESAETRQRRFVSDAAHELRSPVASIRQHAEVAIAHPDATSSRELAGLVHRENLRVERLVDDLLLLARLDEGVGPGADQVDLDDVVLAEAARLRASTSLTVDTTGVGPARVIGRSGELERLVRNLADNAARHAERVVSLALVDDGGRAVFRVDDDGSGVDPSERDRVFDRFVRLDAARSRDGGGAGLGLAIVRAVAEAHGGRVELDSRLGAGAAFTISIPAQRPEGATWPVS